mmetsp:Transcript_15187/g.40021  ORF Transcript_15187/g.40021 Transcript_15187/m.40021 type:complete len:205 (+) Transcript_15187:3-617(+)
MSEGTTVGITGETTGESARGHEIATATATATGGARGRATIVIVAVRIVAASGAPMIGMSVRRTRAVARRLLPPTPTPLPLLLTLLALHATRTRHARRAVSCRCRRSTRPWMRSAVMSEQESSAVQSRRTMRARPVKARMGTAAADITTVMLTPQSRAKVAKNLDAAARGANATARGMTRPTREGAARSETTTGGRWGRKVTSDF